MAYVNFISVDYIFENTLADRNIDVDIINKVIKKAQDIDIQEQIGATLYNKIMNDIDVNGAPTGLYLTLLEDFIQPLQAMFAYVRLFTADYVKMSNKGLLKKTPDGAETIDYSLVNSLKKEEMSDAQFYCERMRSFLLTNIQQFPELNTWSGILTVKPGEAYDNGGLWLSDDCGC